MSIVGMKNYPYVQATFGKSKRLYTFKLDPSILLMKDEDYDVTADGVGYNTPAIIKYPFENIKWAFPIKIR